MKKAGEFFTIRRAHFSKACRLGEEKGWLGNGIAYLVLAKSTDATQRVSTAGVNAIEAHAGLYRSRATEILSVFAEAGIVQSLGGKSRGAPTYKLLFDQADEEQTWLPNAIVDGFALKALKETGKLAVLETFLDVYDNHENSLGGLSLDLLHTCYDVTKEHWPIPLNNEWNLWEFSQKTVLGSWNGTDRQQHVRTLREAGLLHSTLAVFGDDGPDASLLFSMCGTANKASNERLLYNALNAMRPLKSPWLIPLTSKYETPVLRVVVRPFALAETEPTLQFQRERSRVAKDVLEDNLPKAKAAIENHPAAKPRIGIGYGYRSTSEIPLSDRVGSILKDHAKRLSVVEPMTPEKPQEEPRLKLPEFLRKKTAVRTG